MATSYGPLSLVVGVDDPHRPDVRVLLDAQHAELKSMHTAEPARGRGVGQAVLGHLLGFARSEGYERVSLETGTMERFAAARRLYERAGFVPCGPFDDYATSPDNTFMTLDLLATSCALRQRGPRSRSVGAVASGGAGAVAASARPTCGSHFSAGGARRCPGGDGLAP